MNREIPISVIMLTYNRENLVAGMIESILGQTMEEFEFIIVDNGSTDRSGEIAEEYARNDARIKVLHIEKSSIGRGRNVGIAEARGEYIAFVDDDDTCKPEYLEFLYRLMAESSSEIAICGTDRSEHDIHMILETKEALVTLLDRKYYNVGFPTKLIKRSLFEGRMFDEKSRYDDIYLMPKIVAAAEQIVYHGQPFYIVNRHENNNSAWTTNHKLLTRETLEEYLQVYRKRTEWLTVEYPEDRNIWCYYEWSFMISMVDKIKKNKLISCQDLFISLQKKLEKHYDDFINSPKIQEFEKEFMRKYITHV